MERKHIETFEEFISTRADVISGGKGDKIQAEDVNQNELKVGIAVELEHTRNEETAKEIAIDHLTENPKYYSELVQSGIVDEPEAIKLAKELLGVEPKKASEGVEEAMSYIFGGIKVNVLDDKSVVIDNGDDKIRMTSTDQVKKMIKALEGALRKM